VIILGVVSATVLVSTPDQASAGIFCCHRSCYSGGCAPFPGCNWPYWAEPGCGVPRGHHCCGFLGYLIDHCRYCHQQKCSYRYGCSTGCDSGYGGISNCIDGSCGYSGLGSGGCADGNCGGGSYEGGYDGGYDGDVVGESTSGPVGTESNPKVIYDGPAAGAPQIQEQQPVVAPPAGDAAAARQSAHRLASYRRQVNSSFEKGLTLYRERRLNEAATEFQAAVNADPNNALYLYYNALAMYDQHGAEAAGDALQQAIQAERRQAVANWGQAMERVQGQGRLWIEKARRDAGLVR
jgi:hypothetical protein